MRTSYKRKDLESFVEGIIQMNTLIENENPTLVFAPMMGSVPLIDALNVVNPYFDNSRVYYIPASSSLQSLHNILPKTVANILQDTVEEIPEEGLKIISIDEVISGSSAVRMRKKVGEGIKIYAQKKKLSPHENIHFLQVGLEQGSPEEYKRNLNNGYTQLVHSGALVPIGVNKILTLDNPLFCPVRYIPKEDNPARNTPIVENTFHLSKEYIQLLSEIAAFAGTDSDRATPKNYNRILEHQRYIPERYRTLR